MHYSILLPMLIQQLDVVDGRKKIQKIVHILQSAGAPFEERFEFAFFGPYSETLKAELDSLDKFDIISEEISGSSYKFSKGGRFDQVEKSGILANTPPWASFAQILNEKSPRELEALSTVLFLKDKGYEDAKLHEKFIELKKHLQAHLEWATAAGDSIREQQMNWETLPTALSQELVA